MTTPAWALTIAYWAHMLATVVWIGGLAAFSLLVLPVARRALDSQAFSDLLKAVQRRLDPLGWFSILVLLSSGLLQMSANPNYEGFLAITNRWAVAILIKHMMFAIMVGVSVYLTWGLIPALRRTALRKTKGLESPDAEALQQRETRLMRLNLVFGVIVLALTALARSS